MERNVILEEMLLGFPIRCEVTGLDEGLYVLLTGGCRTHIGAVSVCLPGKTPETKVFPGHKEHYISEPWARNLADHFGVPVCVVCGIHYDNVSKDQIDEILACTDKMLQELKKTAEYE